MISDHEPSKIKPELKNHQFIVTEIFNDECQVEEQGFVEETDIEKTATDELTNCDDLNEYEEIFLEYNDEEHLEDIPEEKATDGSIKLNRKSYTATEKLHIVEFAEQNTNRLAARKFGVNESTVRCFRKQKQALLKMKPEKKSNRKASPHWPKLEAELKKYVLAEAESTGALVKMKIIREKAIELAEKHGIPNFNGSNSFVFKFMQRNQIPTASPRARKKIST